MKLGTVVHHIHVYLCVRFLKVHGHAIQCFDGDFFVVETGGEETRGRCVGRNFFFTCSELRNRSMSKSQSVALAESFLSWMRLGFEIMIKKVKTKRQVCPWKMVKNSWSPKQACDRSSPVLVRRFFNTHDLFRCSCVYFATQYNVH